MELISSIGADLQLATHTVLSMLVRYRLIGDSVKQGMSKDDALARLKDSLEPAHSVLNLKESDACEIKFRRHSRRHLQSTRVKYAFSVCDILMRTGSVTPLIIHNLVTAYTGLHGSMLTIKTTLDQLTSPVAVIFVTVYKIV